LRNPLKTLNVVFNFLGSLLLVLSFVLLIPLIVVILNGEVQSGLNTMFAFTFSAVISFALGFILQKLFKSGNPNPVQAIFICSLGWIVVSAVGAIPFVISLNASYLDAYFETMSGFTTTGITMFSGLDAMPRSIIFWRALIQWVGGLGILTFFLAVMSQGGQAHKLFGAESHKINAARPVPGMVNTIKILWMIYSAFTFLIIIGLLLAGSSIFDSICHSFTALSTGGYSPYDASIAHYQQIGQAGYKWIEYILILGMFLGGTNFLIHFRVLSGNPKALFNNTEMKYWFGFIGIFTGVILLERFVKILPAGSLSGSGIWLRLESEFRHTLFQVVSIITTTGFGTVDIGSRYFGHLAKQLFLIMMVIGGCVGSTGGGIKVLRISLLIKMIKREINRLFSPKKAITYIVLNKKMVEKDEIYRVSSLFFAWVVLLIIGGMITAFFSNLNGYSSFSGMFSALGNIGPCYISVEQMGQLHPIIKLTYIFGMLAGRLEILPVLLLFSRRAWKY